MIQLDLFHEKGVEVQDGDVRYILRRNPLRAQELAQNRRDKFAALAARVEKSNRYLQERTKAKVELQVRDLQAFANKLKIASWVRLETDERTRETIDDLSKISLVKVGAGEDWIYRIPEPEPEKQKLLSQIEIDIPAFFPRNGFKIVVNVPTT